MSKIGLALKGDFKRGCLVQIIATLIVVPLVGLLVLYPLYYANTAHITHETQTFIFIAIPIVFLTLFFSGLILFVSIVRYRRNRWLEGIFGESGLGLEGRRYLLNFRQFHGTIGGREVAIYFYRGPTLELYVRTPLQTRLYCNEATQAPRVFGKMELHRVGAEFSEINHLWLSALDQNWGQTLLTDSKVRTLMARIMAAKNSALIRLIQFQPGAVLVKFYRNQNLYRYALTKELAQSWLDDLLELAKLAEALPAPQITAQASKLEQQSQFDRDTMNKKIATIGCSCLGLLIVLLIAIGGAIGYSQFHK